MIVLDPGDQWDQAFITDLLAKVDQTDIEVIIVPGRYWADRTTYINRLINEHKNVLLIVCGDEEATFNTAELEHPNMIVWLQSPHIENTKKADRYFPIGYTPDTRKCARKREKISRWAFSGQNTHSRRKDVVDILKGLDNGELYETVTFNTGLSQKDYNKMLSQTMVAPCPSGAVVPDTFRIYEALENGCVPIVDGLDPLKGSQGYWTFLFDLPEPPFPVLENWSDLPGTIDFFCDVYPQGNNKVFGWWQLQKRIYKTYLQADIDRLRGYTKPDQMTVLVVTSPVHDHPDTQMIEETLNSIRHHTDAEILVLVDGIREEQESYHPQYDEYIHRLLWITNKMEDVTPILFSEHQHQARMTRQALKYVDTPTVMFIEHDTPLVTDYEIPLRELASKVEDRSFDVIRLFHEAGIIPDHKHLMLDEQPKNELLRTAQWSQRPHIANTSYYRELLDRIPSDAHTMIEDAVHGLTQDAYLKLGLPGWNQHRIAIYAPEGNMKRSYHLDGRGDDPKWT